jgi:hypothetical protein
MARVGFGDHDQLGKPVDPRSFYRAFQTRCGLAGVPTTTVHTTRKACA